MTTDARARLLGAALAVLAEDGVEGLTLRAIARRANVSHGAPLKHFPHRAALLSAVATIGFRELAARGRQSAEGCPADASAAQRLRTDVHAYVAYALAHPAMFQLMFRHDLLDSSDRELSRVSMSVFDDRLVALVRDAQKEGWRPDVDTRLLAGAVWSGLHGLAQLWMWGSLPLATGAAEVDDALEALLRAFGLNDIPRAAQAEGHRQ
jgi:AcrR family transcriptional regulator